jgi:hypothetical protein
MEKYNNLIIKYNEFKYFPEEEKTKEICQKACKENGYNINYVSDKYKKSKLFLNICNEDPTLIEYIPKKFHTFLLSEIIFNSSYFYFEVFINKKYDKLNYYNKFLKKDIDYDDSFIIYLNIFQMFYDRQLYDTLLKIVVITISNYIYIFLYNINILFLIIFMQINIIYLFI